MGNMREPSFLNKGIALETVFLLITVIVLHSTGGVEIENQDMMGQKAFPFRFNFDGTTLYVGGSGPGNYSSIQDAVDNASDGDTVYVYNGTYYEHVMIDKSINLIGENKTTTIVDGNETGDVITIFADGVNISEFNVQNSGNTPMVDAGIEAHSNNNIIVGNIVSYNGDYSVGIFLNNSSHNIISDNSIYENGNEGVYLEGSTHNLIQNNEIFNNGHCSVVISDSSYNTIVDNDMYNNHDAAVSLWPGSTNNVIAWNAMHDLPYSGVGIWEGANYNTVHNNHLYNNTLYGVKILAAKGNVIDHNTISGSSKGILLSLSSYTVIKYNNFIENECHAQFDNSSLNRWKSNYWDDHVRFRPKRIDGEACLPWNQSKIIRWFNFDWFPVKEPNEINYASVINQ